MARARSCGLLRSCLDSLTYGFNRFDTFLNVAVLSVVAACLIVASTDGSLDLGALFWLPFGLLVGMIQLLAGIVINTQGFSLVWCAFFGVGVYEEVRWQTFSDSSVLVRGLAALACVLVVLAVALYGIEELVPLPHERHRGARRPCSVICWERAGTTLLHLLTMLIAAVATLVADEWHSDRRGGFYAALGGSALLLLCCTPLALRCRRSAARVQPMTAEQMALALLQEQLLKTRDRLAQLRGAQLERQKADQPTGGSESEAEANEMRELQMRERALLARIESKLSPDDGAGVRVSTTGSGTIGPPILDDRLLAPIT